MMDTLKNKVILITGASSGIGRASARYLSSLGAKVILNYFRSEQSARDEERAIREQGGDCLLIQADVTNPDDVRRMVLETLEAYGQIDVLINNAGGAVRRSSFLECDENLWDSTLDLNLKSAYLCSQAVLHHMVERQRGKIINISSVAARHGSPGETVHYAVAKGGLNTLTLGLSREFAKYGILVNAIAPGLIDTPFQEKYSTPERIKRVCEAIPLQRAGRPEEVVELIAFLSSDASNYITGEVITISGGR